MQCADCQALRITEGAYMDQYNISDNKINTGNYMFKKFFLLLIVAMLNVVAWGTDHIDINRQYNAGDHYEVHVGDTKFAEPAVTVRDDGNNNVTSGYTIEYSVCGAADGSYPGSETTNDMGAAIIVDDNAGGNQTRTTVEKYYGDVIMGTAGTVYVKVTATKKSDSTVLPAAYYKIVIEANPAELTFTPAFTGAPWVDGHYASAIISIKPQVDNSSLMQKAVMMLPTYVITTTNSGGVVKDITDHYTVSISYTHDTGIHPLSFDNNDAPTKLQRASEAAWVGTEYGTLTYTFTPIAAYSGTYETITKTIDVTFEALTGEAAKKTVSLNFQRNNFKQENVTEEGGTYTIHVYKFGQSDIENSSSNYHYKSPVPSLLSEGGASLPLNINNSSYGDFRLIYQIVEDNTYYDDCDFLYSTRQGSVQAAGEKTGLTIGDVLYQVSKPGLVKVAVYGVLDGVYDDNGYGANLKAMYEPYKPNGRDTMVITGQWNDKYTVYAEPQYFYIDVMKRQPSIVMTPDASSINFLAGDVITMDDRIEISAVMGDDSNGIAGALKFAENDGWSDHFAYQFFISDRMADGLIHIDWYAYANGTDTKDNHPGWDANGGDQYSYIDWHATGAKKSDNIVIQKGDIIKTGNTIVTTATEDFNIFTAGGNTRNLIGQTITVGDNSILVTPDNIDELVGVKAGETITVDEYVLITEDNIDEYSGTHAHLEEGDFEKGITYNSMKGYKNEEWEITFLNAGNYVIPYTARPWNHTKWDNSDVKTITFNVVEDPYPTAIRLSYKYKVIKVGESATAPTDKVVVPSWNDYDVTVEGGFRYSTTEPAHTYNGFSYSFKDGYTTSGDIQTHTATGCTLNTKTGEITTSSSTAGEFTVYVNATAEAGYTKYANPSQVEYTIRIVNDADLARWEIISSCKGSAVHGTNPRFTDISKANGRMHFLTKTGYVSGSDAGAIYGGTMIEGVPGITMTLGAPATDAESAADWRAVATDEDTKKCDAEETKSVIVRSVAPVVLDPESKDGIPMGGAFYQFNPLVNGYLTIDAKVYKDHTIVLLSQQNDGEIITEILRINDLTAEEKAAMESATSAFDGDGNLLGDYTFKKALLAGETYYLYDVTNSMELNLHGFSYTPAYIRDRNTTLAESQTPIDAYTFMNGLMSSVPKLMGSVDAPVNFEVIDYYSEGKGTTAILGINEKGELDPKQMTLRDNGTIFKLRVKATVHSSDETTWGDCVAKETYFDIAIIDIPTYAVSDDMDKFANIEVGKTATTENISTDIIMTYGGWKEDSGEDQKYHYDYDKGAKEDTWTFKSTGGPASRIGSELADNAPEYNRTIDGFEFFNAGNNNPVDELNKSALQKVSDKQPIGNDNSYTYGSGTAFETSDATYYNTTYRLPARGAYLKFEPRESGTLLVYLVQNGSCDYHEGVVNIDKSYQIKWRPLYITDETGKPVEMEDDFSGTQFLPTGNDATHRGSYTLGISRCGKNPDAIREAWPEKDKTADRIEDGCAFDWSEFRGTSADRTHLLEAWPAKGERESIIRLANGGFVLPHKAYVRYAFHVKAGKTYFVFQPGSKPEFGGFSFLPTGYPSACKYAITSEPGALVYNATNQEKNWSGAAASSTETEATYDANGIATDKAVSSRDINFTWDTSSTRFTENKENLIVTINDRRNSELTNESYDDRNTMKARTFTANNWESLCLPFSVSEQEMTRVFGENYVLLTCDGVNDKQELHFVRHANRYVEAGRPYLIKPTQDIESLTFHNVSIEGTATVKNLAGDSDIKVTDPSRFNVNVNDGEFTFKGTLMRTTLPEKSIFAKGEGLYISNTPTAQAKIGGYRAFFYKENDSSSPSLSMAFTYDDLTPEAVYGDEPTGVIIVEGTTGSIREVSKSDAIYNVSGQKYSDNPLDLNGAPSGVYIIGGQTIIK